MKENLALDEDVSIFSGIRFAGAAAHNALLVAVACAWVL